MRKKLQDLAKQTGQNRKIRASAHFNELKTYKSAKKISLFLVRLLSKGKVLEFRVVDYEPTDFLTGTYKDQMNPGWGDPPQYPMRELYPLVFRFTKVE